MKLTTTEVNILWALYILSFIYCMWRMIKRYKYSSFDGVIGVSPGLDLIAAVFLAPILAIADLVVTAVKFLKKKISRRRD